MDRAANEFRLLASRRFAPLFATNLLGTLNDNLFKTALLMLTSYVVFRAEPGRAALLASLATGVFVTPFFLFSALAGQVADRFDRARLVRLVKTAEVAIMALGLVGFRLQSPALLLGALFLMGVHSSVYGPLKYAILPQQLHAGELLAATGLMEAGGFVAIITGQLLAGLMSPLAAGAVACSLAALGLLASMAIAPCRPRAPASIDANLARVSWQLVRQAASIRVVWLSVLGIAWFFAVGAVLLSELIPLVKDDLHATQEVAVFFLALFSLGIAAGSLLANRLLRGEVSGRYAPLAALAMGALLTDLAFAAHLPAGGAPLRLAGLLGAPAAWRVVFDLTTLSVSGGVFVIPLYALLQTHSPADARARILAGNNIVNAGVSVLVVAAASAVLAAGLPVNGLLALLGVATGVVGIVSAPLSGQRLWPWKAVAARTGALR